MAKINTELGAQSTFASVPFDKAVLNVGDTGYHACNGFSVDRIDEKIQKEVFKISTDNNGPTRVCGIRDYNEQLVYWSFPSVENPSSQVFLTSFSSITTRTRPGQVTMILLPHLATLSNNQALLGKIP